MSDDRIPRKDRPRICEVCGDRYTSAKPSPRYCSVPCKTSRGAWSYPSNKGASPRVFGEARS